jgi:hypothetical protein
MLTQSTTVAPARIFSLQDWERWLDRTARAIFGISGAEFEAAYASGEMARSGSAEDLGSVLELIKRLRRNQ